MPPGFNFPLRLETTARLPSAQMQYWIPMGFDLAKSRAKRWTAWTIARVKPGVPLTIVSSRLDVAARELELEHPNTNANQGATAIPLRLRVNADTRQPVIALAVAIALVLLLSSVNISSLLLARAETRRVEMAVRLALGATRGQLMRLSIVEALLLATAGCVMGSGLAALLIRAVIHGATSKFPRLEQTRLDPMAVGFAALISLAVGLLTGASGSWRTSWRHPQETLATGGRGNTRRPVVLSWLVGGEVALAFLLVSGAGLLLHSFVALMTVDPGYRPDPVLMSVVVPTSRQSQDPRVGQLLFRKIIDGLRQAPGVDAVAASRGLPVVGQYGSIGVHLSAAAAAGTPPDVQADLNQVTPDYMRVMSIPLRKGRLLTEQDGEGSPLVALVDEILARRLWPGQDPIGQVIALDTGIVLTRQQVVGVVGSSRNRSLEIAETGGVFVPIAQTREIPNFVILRSSRPRPEELLPAVRDAVAAADPNQPIFFASSMRQLLADSIASRRYLLGTVLAFGAAALLLAALGLFGLVSFTVSGRVREIGIRMALGSTPGRVILLVLGDGLRLTGIGVIAGLAASLGASRLLGSLLFGISSVDFVALGLSAGALLLASLAAAWLPARRAAKIAPLEALRAD